MTNDLQTAPHNLEAEESLIGSILINSDLFPEITTIVKASDFHVHANQWMWEAFESLTAKREPIDYVTVSNHLENNGKLNEMGGAAHLTKLVNMMGVSLNAEAYARIVKECSERRHAIKFANKIAQAAYKTDEPFDSSTFLKDLIHSERQETRKTPIDVSGEIYADLYENRSLPFTTGISDLDDYMGGMFKTELTILAGDQGTGKSALMIWMARANAKRKTRVLGVSLEMQAKNWFMRMACGDLGVSWNQVRANKVDDSIRQDVWMKSQELVQAYNDHLVIYEDPMTLQAIQAAVMRERPDIVLIDHVFLIAGMKETRNGIDKIDQLNSITRFLRQNIAKPFDCHVVLLWQLNRSSAKEKRKPTKHDLYMAGTNDPDNILLLHRPDQYDDDMQANSSMHPVVDMDVIVGKSRNDYTGSISVKFDLPKQAFGGLARETHSEGK